MTAPATPPQPLRAADQPIARAPQAPPAASTAHLAAFAPDFETRRAEAMRHIRATELPIVGQGIRGKVGAHTRPANR